MFFTAAAAAAANAVKYNIVNDFGMNMGFPESSLSLQERNFYSGHTR